MLDRRILKRDKKEGRAWGEESEEMVEGKEERQETRDKRR